MITYAGPAENPLSHDASARGRGARVPGSWQTPGTFMCERVAGIQQVRAVLEQVEPDRFTVFLLLDDDPDEVLDRIFDEERELMSQFRNMPCDVRVMKMSAALDVKAFARGRLLHYERRG